MATSPTPGAPAHDHVFLSAAHDDHARRTLWVVALTAAMMVVEIVAGYATGSMALLADGFHMATHAGALGVSAAAYAYAKRNVANPAFSFGTGKVGDLAGFASALTLGLIAIGIGVESLRRLFEPSSVAFGEAAVIAVVGLIVNIVSAFLLSGGHHHHGDDHAHDHHHHGQGRDNNLQSAYMHVLADALTSVLAIVALLAGRFAGWTFLDPVMGIVGALVIARWSWTLLGDTAAVLLDTTDTHVADEVRELIAQEGDAALTDLHVWRVGPEAHAAIVSLTSATLDVAAVRQRLSPVDELRHLTIEVQRP